MQISAAQKRPLEQAKEMMERNGGNIDLSDTAITSLPDNLTVGGFIWKDGIVNVKK